MKLPVRGSARGRGAVARLPNASDVPTVAVAGDPGVNVPEGAFGVSGDVASAAADLADTFNRAAKRQQNRTDTVSRADAINRYTEDAGKLYRDSLVETDLSDPVALENVGKKLSDMEANLLEEHGGSEDSRALLTSRLGGLRSHYSELFANKATEIGVAKVSTRLSADISKVLSSGDDIQTQLDTVDGIIDDWSGSLPEETEQTYRETAYRDIGLARINNALEANDAKSARAMFKAAPSMNIIFSPDQQRQITTRLIKAEKAEDDGRKAGEKRLREAATILGIDDIKDVPVNVRATLVGMPTKSGPMTGAEKVADFEATMTKATGKPYTATPEQVARIFKIEGEENGGFGNGLTGRALSIMTEGAPAFAAGLMAPDEERRFLSAVTEYAQPSSFQNPDTGIMQTRNPALPAFVTEALERRGIELPSVSAQSTPAPQSVAQPGEESPEGMASGRSLWGMASDVTGPVPAIAEAVGRVPIVGDLVPSSKITQARNFIPLMQNDLVRVLQNNPRYAEGERQAIKKETNIDSNIIDTPTAYRNRLIAIDDALEIRQNNALSTANNPNVGRDERVQALNVLNALTKFRVNMGVPVRVKTPEEAMKLPPGTEIILPDGSLGKVPEQGAAPDPAAAGNGAVIAK